MMSHSYRYRRLAALAGVTLLAAAALAACGRQGPLERPAPLFGSRARAQYEAERAQEAADDAQREAQARSGTGAAGAAQPIPPSERRDPNQQLNPASTNPVPGAPNPFGVAAPPGGR